MSSARRAVGVAVPAIVLVACIACIGCNEPTPLQPVNRDPVVHSLYAFPTAIAPGDSAIVICLATDPDADTVVYDWSSDCRMVKQGRPNDFTLFNDLDGRLVVHAGACNRAPLDTGWVSCYVRDGRGGGKDAGHVLIIVRQ